MQIKLKIIKILIVMLLITVDVNIFADEALDKKLGSLPQLESVFLPTSETMNVTTANKNVNWEQSGIGLKINNQWQLTITSKQDITVSKISINIDGVIVSNQANLTLLSSKNSAATQYLFATDDFQKHVYYLIKGYKLLGIVKQITANDYSGYQDYAYKVIKVTLSWKNSTTYNESTTNFLMVYAK